MERRVGDLTMRLFDGDPPLVKIESEQMKRDGDPEAAGVVVVYPHELDALIRFLQEARRRLSIRRGSRGGSVTYRPSYSATFGGYAGRVEAWAGQGEKPCHVRIFGLESVRPDPEGEVKWIAVDAGALPALIEALAGAAEALGITGADEGRRK